jgi:hypothetical protein
MTTTCEWCVKETKQLFDEPGRHGDCASQICRRCFEMQCDAKMNLRRMISGIVEELEYQEENK